MPVTAAPSSTWAHSDDYRRDLNSFAHRLHDLDGVDVFYELQIALASQQHIEDIRARLVEEGWVLRAPTFLSSENEGCWAGMSYEILAKVEFEIERLRVQPETRPLGFASPHLQPGKRVVLHSEARTTPTAITYDGEEVFKMAGVLDFAFTELDENEADSYLIENRTLDAQPMYRMVEENTVMEWETMQFGEIVAAARQNRVNHVRRLLLYDRAPRTQRILGAISGGNDFRVTVTKWYQHDHMRTYVGNPINPITNPQLAVATLVVAVLQRSTRQLRFSENLVDIQAA